jgi:membrane peptidoglycan carboxypeptidase
VVLLAFTGLGANSVQIYIASVVLPAAPLTPQASTLYYRDGRTILGRVGVTDHSDVPLSAVPLSVRRAVLSAEDRTYYEHSAVSLRGVLRASVADVNGDEQGASTITQQYARTAYLAQSFSVGRKAKEFAYAVKLERRYTKNEILERYLNLIYFGRGAYGIAAAAHAYFGIAPQQLTAAQGAVLAAVIKDPRNYDPAVDERAARSRWNWIIAGEVAQHWLSKADAAALRYPDVLARSAQTEAMSGPNGLVMDQVERELNAHGISSQDLHTKGLTVVTTLDPVAQQAALTLVPAAVKAQPNGLHAALVALDPSNGAVRAYYGGDHGTGFFDDAEAPRPPASTFKPIVLAVGMQHGVSYLSRWDGSSPQIFPDRNGTLLNNRQDLQCPNCTLEEAMVQSLNTPYYALAQQFGAAQVRAMALKLGVSASYQGVPSMVDLKGDPWPGRTRADIAIGRYPVSPADVASVYATFAAGGVRSTRYFVQSVTAADGVTLLTAKPERTAALDPKIVADVSTVLQSVVAKDGSVPGRPAAGKTGTQQWGNTRDNQDAWMAGYTPQLATAVWMGRSVPGPIKDASGNPIAGDTVPMQLWREFLQSALDGQTPAKFPAAAHVGRTDTGNVGHNPYAMPAKGSSTSPDGRTVDRTEHTGKYLALTFDDGPSDYTNAVLDLLAEYHVHATFCLVGENVENYPTQVRRIVNDGHRLCNHSTHHDDLSRSTDAQVHTDIAATDALIAAAAPGATVTYFRAPYGNWGNTPKVATSMGHTPLGWAVDSEDWQVPGVNTIVNNIKQHLHPGNVVLVHDAGGNRQQTIDALKILIPQLLHEGWTFDFPKTTVHAHPLPRPSPDAPGGPPASPSTSPAPAGSATTPSPTLSGSPSE